MRATGSWMAVLPLLGLAACGGGPEPRPAPLRHHFDDMHIAAVAMTEKQAVITAQNDYSVAKMERAKAESDYSESSTKLEVAGNERQQALLAEKSAKSEKKAADATADMTRINKAASELRTAELTRRAADEKVTWLKVQRAYLSRHLLYTEENMYAQEAAYELAKARVAKTNNIQPKGFRVEDYEKQAKERATKVQRRRTTADKERAKADAKKQKWDASLREANRAKGIGSS